MFVGGLLLLAVFRPAFDDLLEPADEATVREYVQIMVRGVLAATEGVQDAAHAEEGHEDGYGDRARDRHDT